MTLFKGLPIEKLKQTTFGRDIRQLGRLSKWADDLWAVIEDETAGAGRTSDP